MVLLTVVEKEKGGDGRHFKKKEEDYKQITIILLFEIYPSGPC